MFRLAVAAMAASLAATLAGGRARAQDVTLEQRVVTTRPLADGSRGRSVRRRTIRLKGRKARSDDDSGETVVLLLDRKQMYTMDNLVKTYRVRNFEEAEKMGTIQEDLMVEQIKRDPRHSKRIQLIDKLSDGPTKWKMIREHLTGDYQKRMLEKYGLRLKPPVIEVTGTTETKYICNYKCRKYIAKEDGEEMSSAWVTEKLELEPELYMFLEKTGIISHDLAEKLKTIEGLPLAYNVSARNGRITETTTLAVDLRKVDNEYYRVPPRNFRREEGR